MPISFTHNCVFIHIPKTGGQSISKLLGIPKGSHKHYYAEGLTHLTLPMIEEKVDVSGKYIFTFVRDPYDKIKSEYAWRMRNRHSQVYNEPTRKQIDFPEYMELLLSRWDKLVPAWREKAHVMPQVSFLDPRVNVFRFEEFKESCEVLMRMFGIDGPIPYVNKGHSLPKHTERTKEITRILYEEDFKRFRYEL
jgi:hypothetical protein